MQLFIILIVIAGLLLVWFSISAVGLIIHFIPWLIIGLIAGAIASAITGSRHGILGDIGLGLVGSVLGGVLMRLVFHYNASGFLSDILVGTVGAVILLLIGKAISRRRTYY